MKPWDAYIKDVQSGKRIAGELEKLAVKRFVHLRKKKEYFFDVHEAEEKLHVVSKFRHATGRFTGQPFNPMPWQSFLWAWMFGLKYRESGFRVTREVLLCMAKKGGKSVTAGATAVLMEFFDGEHRAECYSAANSTDQALFSWNAARDICKRLAIDEPEFFGSRLKLYDSFNSHDIIDLETDSFFKAISAETKTLDGVNPHFAVIDEFHEARTDAIPKNLKSGMVNREQPILMYSTTRGFLVRGELKKLESKHIGLLKNRFQDDSAISLIFSFDPADEKKFKRQWGKPVDKIDQSAWTKPNPGLGVAPTVAGLEAMYTDAVNEGQSAQTNTMVKNFNMWVRQSKTWLSIDNWNKCAKKIDVEALAGRECYGAYDLSTKWDLTAKGLLFPPIEDEEDFIFLCKYYCPEDGVKFRSERDKVPYDEWVKEGRLIATPGNVIDYDYIQEDIMQDHEKYEVIDWGYDPMFATDISTKLSEAGLHVASFRQTTFMFNEAIEKLEEIILAANPKSKLPPDKKVFKLNKGDDPILDWMFENIALNTSRSGLKMFDKAASQEKIDGMVVLAMCMGKKGVSGYMDGGKTRNKKGEVNIFWI